MAAGESNRTLWVAVAGIAATALVGLGGTGAAWWSARDDRAAQRDLAREQRSYEHKVSVYLDAIHFVEGQERSFYEYGAAYDANGGLDSHFTESGYFTPRDFIPFKSEPPQSLSERLRLFGSDRVFQAFFDTQHFLPYYSSVGVHGQEFLSVDREPGEGSPFAVKEFQGKYQSFYRSVTRFETAVRRDLYLR